MNRRKPHQPAHIKDRYHWRAIRRGVVDPWDSNPQISVELHALDQKGDALGNVINLSQRFISTMVDRNTTGGCFERSLMRICPLLPVFATEHEPMRHYQQDRPAWTLLHSS